MMVYWFFVVCWLDPVYRCAAAIEACCVPALTAEDKKPFLCITEHHPVVRLDM